MKSSSLNTIESFSEIVRFVLDHNRFAITSHSNPDGDSIGSQVALALALEQIAKSTRIVNSDPVPPLYRFLPGTDAISIASSLEGDWDAVFVLECNSLRRPEVRNLERYRTINIDHHADGSSYADLNWVDPSAAAVAEMVYQLVTGLSIPVSPEVAANLYAGILTDTGSFQFSNTTSRTFQISSQLMRCGADPSQIARAVYQNFPVSKIRLMARVLSTLKVHPSGKLAWITLTDSILEQTGAEKSDTEGLVNYPLSISGVMLAAFFREDGGQSTRVSLRSKSDLDVRQVARLFGGGGHPRAAGLTVQQPLDEALGSVLSELTRLLGES